MTANSVSERADLRSYVDYVRRKGAGSYVEVERAISPRWYTTAINQHLAAKLRNPVIMFRNIEGSPYPMVTNVCCSFARVAGSMNWSADELQERLIDALHLGIAPKVVNRDAAPVCDEILGIRDHPLSLFPQLFYTETQTSAYITSSILIARDATTGAHNMSFHRLMILDDENAAIYMTPGGHLDHIWRANSNNGRATPVAAVIGNHPLWSYGSLVSGALADDDYDVIGAVLGAPLAVTPSHVDDRLLIPANAEFALQGRIECTETAAEGPFGEFLGYVAPRADRPVIRFEMVAHRRNPIFQDIVAGQAEHLAMSTASLRAKLQRNYFRDNDAIIDFWLPAPMTIFIAIDDAVPEFDAHELMCRLLKEEKFLKHAVCFDQSVDLRKQASVQSALACFVQSDRDQVTMPGLDGNGVDPSENGDRTTKTAIDARSRGRPVISRVPADIMESVDLKDWIK